MGARVLCGMDAPTIVNPKVRTLPTPAPEYTISLAPVVARGMTLMVATSVLTKLATFAAQIVLGWKLSRGDFALFSTATAVTGLLTVCRGLGIRELLLSRGREEYMELSGAAFWLSATFNTLTAGVIAMLAWPASVYVFGAPELCKLLLVMALALPLSSSGGIQRTKVRLDLRFRAFTGIILASALARQIVTIGLALAGFGAMSMAASVAAAALAESVIAAVVSTDQPWKLPAQVARWPWLIRQSVWPMVSSITTFMRDWAQFLVLGRMLGANAPVLGLFGFAYNIIAQVGVLLSENGQVVLIPALVRMRAEPERQIVAALRALRVLMLVGSLSSIGLATIVRPVEHVIWHGRWAAAVPAVMVLGVFFSWKVTTAVTSAILTARRRFRAFSVITFVEGLGVSACAWVAVGGAGHGWPASAGSADDTAVTIALWTGAWVFLSRLGFTLYVLVSSGGRARDVVAAVLPVWIIALGAGAAGTWAGQSTAAALHLPDHGAASVIADLTCTLVSGSVCAVAFIGVVRFVQPSQLSDAIGVVPGRFRGLAARALFLDADFVSVRARE